LLVATFFEMPLPLSGSTDSNRWKAKYGPPERLDAVP